MLEFVDVSFRDDWMLNVEVVSYSLDDVLQVEMDGEERLDLRVNEVDDALLMEFHERMDDGWLDGELMGDVRTYLDALSVMLDDEDPLRYDELMGDEWMYDGLMHDELQELDVME